MKVKRRYLVAVVLLAGLAVAFGVFGTVAPPLEGAAGPQPMQGSSSSESVGHFQNPPSYDSGWVDISSKAGQHVTLTHGLNTTDVVVDITGKQWLESLGGGLAWSRTYGGTGIENGYSLIQTSDGGYALAGSSSSTGTAGLDDFWLARLDASGNKLWDKFYGGTGADYCYSVIQTVDGGFALAGRSYPGPNGFNDYWLVKTDASGNRLWDMFYGGDSNDFGYTVVQTSDGGYALAGASGSTGSHGGFDFWLVKTDAAGVKESDWFYGGVGQDYAYSLVVLDSGEYVLAGSSTSTGTHGIQDFWLVMADAFGSKLWDKFYGGTGADEANSLVQTVDGGFALAGYSNSLGTAGGDDFWLVKTDASGNPLWDEFYGGTGQDRALSLVENGDLEFVLAGYSNSLGTVGLIDAWLVKTDLTGGMLWNQTYGGIINDYARSVILTSDCGYAFGGDSNSYSVFSDINNWVVKVNGEKNREHRKNFGEGSTVSGWSRVYGESDIDVAIDIIQTRDGGYALAGDSLGPSGNRDFWLVKTDASGNKLWDKFYSSASTSIDFASSLVQTSDGGYALAGESSTAGGVDLWLVKTDALGNKLWDEFYGGTGGESIESPRCLVQTNDGGYALVGWSTSPGTAGERDFWLVRTDASGNQLWDKFFGGTSRDMPASLVQTSDGGFALAGHSGDAGVRDFWLVRTDASGNKLWDSFYGGTGDDVASSMCQTVDGGFALAGFSTSLDNWRDFWLVKTDSSGNPLWDKFFGVVGWGDAEEAHSIVQTSDGGYALAGVTQSVAPGEYYSWLVKTNALGDMQWSQVHGLGSDWLNSMVHTSDGGYALTGYTDYFGGQDLIMVKTDVENGLNWVGSTNRTITLYRGKTDLYWNYVRVRMWLIREPSWIYGDINMDGTVDVRDLYILSRNYGKTFSLLSLSGIAFIAGIQVYKKRKPPK